MGWVNDALKELKEARVVSVRAYGGSMRGKIENGQLVTIEPTSYLDIKIGDIVFVKWKTNYLLHLVIEISQEQILIGNNLGKINGWVERKDIIGKVINVSD